MRIVCFASPKGGAGKTLLSTTFAQFLGGIGKRVLLIDTDAATNGLSLLHLTEMVNAAKTASTTEARAEGVFEAAGGNPAVPFAITASVDLVPASYARRDTEQVPLEAFVLALEATVRTASSETDRTYNYIILDAQAGSDAFAQVAMKSADQVVLVSEYDPVSLAGIDRLRKLFPDALDFDRHWILLNKLLPDFTKSFTDFLSLARYLPPIPWEADVVRAYANRRLALDMTHGNSHTLAIMRSASALFGEEIEEALSEWRAQKEASFRAPYQDQISEIEQRLSAYREALHEREYARRAADLRPRQLTYAALLAVVLALAGGTIAAVQDLGALPLALLGVVPLVVGVALITYRLASERWRLRTEFELETEVEGLRTRVDDLEAERRKLRSLIDSDVDELVMRPPNAGRAWR